MEEEKDLVHSRISGKKVVVFSKSTCPFCKKAKETISHYVGSEITEEDFDFCEIDLLPNHSKIQDYLKELTGARSVPKVFINQKFAGGHDDIVAKHKNGQLGTLLSQKP